MNKPGKIIKAGIVFLYLHRIQTAVLILHLILKFILKIENSIDYRR
jgi:hypothetical protein